MEVRIQAIHFEIADRLTQFVEKKIQRLTRRNDTIISADVNLRLIKPEAADNKEAIIKVLLPGQELVVTKTADTFEEAVDQSLEALDKMLEKVKNKNC